MKSRTGYGIYDKDADSLYSPYLYDEQYEAESVAYDYNRGHQQCTQVWNEDELDERYQTEAQEWISDKIDEIRQIELNV